MVGYPTRLVEIIGSQLCGPPQDAFSLSLVTSDPIACDAPSWTSARKQAPTAIAGACMVITWIILTLRKVYRSGDREKEKDRHDYQRILQRLPNKAESE